MPHPYRYLPRLRPVSSVTLPEGLEWDYVEAPHFTGINRPDLPRSANRYGMIATARELTAAERSHFGLELVVEG